METRVLTREENEILHDTIQSKLVLVSGFETGIYVYVEFDGFDIDIYLDAETWEMRNEQRCADISITDFAAYDSEGEAMRVQYDKQTIENEHYILN